MKKAEIIIVTLSIIALGLNLLLIPGSGVLTVFTLSTLSILYMYLSFALFNDIKLRTIFKKDSYKRISKLRIIGAIGTGFALSLTTIGILFKFQSWPGALSYMEIGFIGLLIVILIGINKYLKNKSNFYTKIFKRVAIFGGLVLILLLTPTTTWVEIKFRNHPAYVDALKKVIADPNNKELRDKVDVERQKINNENQRE